MTDELTLPTLDDFHVHLRQDAMMNAVTPLIRPGGAKLVYVMPNLVPPITTTAMAQEYRAKLKALDSTVEYLMTLYLSPSLTPDEVRRAKAAGISGVKSYPRGVTTNSAQGIEDYAVYYPVFMAMEECGMVLNLHGEVPSNDHDVCVMNAEERFLEHLRQLHRDFPRLKIVLEHATTRAAVETVKELGDTVGCTITPHHLVLIVDDWAGQPFNFCKPVAKYPSDREALRQVILERTIYFIVLINIGHPRFFLGSDSAPHVPGKKLCACAAAGIYTTPYLAQYLAHALDSFGALDRMHDFACVFGRRFYGMKDAADTTSITLVRQPMTVPDSIHQGPEAVVPFLAGKTLNWSLKKQ